MESSSKSTTNSKMKTKNTCENLYNIRAKISQLNSKIKKLEKEMNFEEILILRDKVYKLKKLEKDIILEKMNERQAKEKDKLIEKHEIHYSKLYLNTERQKNRLENKIKYLNTDFQTRQQFEKEKFQDEFDKFYPKEKPIIGDVVTLKDRINTLVKEKNYKSANKYNNELYQFQIKRHHDYIDKKNKEFHYAIKNLLYDHQKEEKEHFNRINKLKENFEYQNKHSYTVYEITRNKKDNKLKQIQNNEVISIQNLIYNNNIEEGFKDERKDI